MLEEIFQQNINWNSKWKITSWIFCMPKIWQILKRFGERFYQAYNSLISEEWWGWWPWVIDKEVLDQMHIKKHCEFILEKEVSKVEDFILKLNFFQKQHQHIFSGAMEQVKQLLHQKGEKSCLTTPRKSSFWDPWL